MGGFSCLRHPGYEITVLHVCIEFGMLFIAECSKGVLSCFQAHSQVFFFFLFHGESNSSSYKKL